MKERIALNSYIQQGDCLELMKQVPNGSIDMILTDPPFGQTKNKWDKIIDLDAMWMELKRIVKPSGAILLFADGMYLANLMVSNKEMWRYNLIWDKQLPTGFLNANRMPLRKHETICVFYQKLPTYNPQFTIGKPSHNKGKLKAEFTNNTYGKFKQLETRKDSTLKYPTSIIALSKIHPSKTIHPTQKPVDLLEYLINTYTDPGDIVLDTCMGSGSTCVACMNTYRRFIGYELDKEYYQTAKDRIDDIFYSRKKEK